MRHTQREHTKVTKKVTEIESCLAKANAEKKRLRTNVKESKTAAAVAAALQARLDVERQVTLEMKAAKNNKRTLKKRLARAHDKAAQGTTPKLRSCRVTEFNNKKTQDSGGAAEGVAEEPRHVERRAQRGPAPRRARLRVEISRSPRRAL